MSQSVLSRLLPSGFAFVTLFVAQQAVAQTPSSFQKTCDNVRYEERDGNAGIAADCRRSNGETVPAYVDILGIANHNGVMSLTEAGAKSSMVRTCTDLEIRMGGKSNVYVAGKCQKEDGDWIPAQKEIWDVENIDGCLQYYWAPQTCDHDSGQLGNGVYSIQPSHSGKCLDVEAGSQDDAGNVYQYGCHGKNNQLWAVTRQNDGNYLIKPIHSDKCLDIAVHPDRPDEGASKENFANVIQWQCHGGPMQSWALTATEGKTDTFEVKSVHSDKCLDISGHGKDDRANLHMYDCHKGPNQQFLFVAKADG